MKNPRQDLHDPMVCFSIFDGNAKGMITKPMTHISGIPEVEGIGAGSFANGRCVRPVG